MRGRCGARLAVRCLCVGWLPLFRCSDRFQASATSSGPCVYVCTYISEFGSSLLVRETTVKRGQKGSSRVLVRSGVVLTTPCLASISTTHPVVKEIGDLIPQLLRGRRGPPRPRFSDSPHQIEQFWPTFERAASSCVRRSFPLVGFGPILVRYLQFYAETPQIEVPAAPEGGLAPDRGFPLSPDGSPRKLSNTLS